MTPARATAEQVTLRGATGYWRSCPPRVLSARAGGGPRPAAGRAADRHALTRERMRPTGEPSPRGLVRQGPGRVGRERRSEPVAPLAGGRAAPGRVLSRPGLRSRGWTRVPSRPRQDGATPRSGRTLSPARALSPRAIARAAPCSLRGGSSWSPRRRRSSPSWRGPDSRRASGFWAASFAACLGPERRRPASSSTSCILAPTPSFP
jgi:hypothetical protein